MPPKTGQQHAPAAAAAAAPAADARATIASEVTQGTGLAGTVETLDADATSKPKTGSSFVTWEQLFRFLFPPELEHPDSAGRLELFARYGPVDQDGQLRGGICGSHVHTALEIRQMIKVETREALFAVLGKPRATVEVVVDGALPLALEQTYTQAEVRQLLRRVPGARRGEMPFSELQDAILESRRARLKALLQDGALSARGGRTPRVPYQSQTAEILLYGLDKRKHTPQEEYTMRSKRLGRYSCLIGTLESQNETRALTANVTILRPVGGVDDRWDRYCAVRRMGRSSYVQARNTPRTPRAGPTDVGDALADRHPGCASLLAAGHA